MRNKQRQRVFDENASFDYDEKRVSVQYSMLVHSVGRV